MPDPDRPTLMDIARQAADGQPDQNAAVTAALARLDADADLFRSLARPMVEAAVRQAVHQVRHDAIGSIKAGVCSRGLEAIAGASGAAAMSILDSYPVPAGKMLGDMMGEELAPLADADAERARGYLANAIFYRSLAVSVPPGRRVRDCVTPDDAARMLWHADQQAREQIKAAAGQYAGDTPIKASRRRPEPRRRANSTVTPRVGLPVGV